MTESVRSLLSEAEHLLAAFPNGRLEAEIMLHTVLEADRSWLYAHADEIVTGSHAADFHRLVHLRSTGYPVAYLTGLREFWSLSLEVTAETLIPRPETEHLVETALELSGNVPDPEILDLGTGCGPIAVALAVERPDARITATDISAGALAVAERNIRRFARGRVRCRHSDWYGGVGRDAFDLILCNPPYVDSTDPVLIEEEIRFEPRLALDGGPGGLQALGVVIAGAPAHLHSGGAIAVEHGQDQGEIVRRLLRHAAFDSVASVRDLAGRERITFGRWT